MDFDPNNDFHFPQAVELKHTSRQFMEMILNFHVPSQHAALWFLGNNSFIAKSHLGTVVIVDPYLTDFCASKRTRTRVPKSRLLPVFIEPEDLKADLVLLTHSHCDHTDPFTLERLNIKESALFAGPFQTLPLLKESGIPSYATRLMHPKEVLIFRDLTVTGTFAEPTDSTDLNHMGFGVRFQYGPLWYISGDTAFSERIGGGLSEQPEVMSICINGGYHNLSHWEAAKVCTLVKPLSAVPCHFDMMPHNLQPPHIFRKSLWEHTHGDVEYVKMDYAEPYLIVPGAPLRKFSPL